MDSYIMGGSWFIILEKKLYVFMHGPSPNFYLHLGKGCIPCIISVVLLHLESFAFACTVLVPYIIRGHTFTGSHWDRKSAGENFFKKMVENQEAAESCKLNGPNFFKQYRPTGIFSEIPSHQSRPALQNKIKKTQRIYGVVRGPRVVEICCESFWC